MRIAIDARELVGRPTGVGTLPDGAPSRLARAPHGGRPRLHPVRPRWRCACLKPCPARTSLVTAPGSGTRWEQITLRRLLRTTRADVLLAPAYSGPLWCRVPMVLTVHDVSFAAHPEWFSWREGTRRRLLARLAAARAVRVLTLSEFSRRGDRPAPGCGAGACRSHPARGAAPRPHGASPPSQHR